MKKYFVVLFIFLARITFLVIVFPFHAYLSAVLFASPPPAAKMAAAEYQKIPIPIPLIILLKNDSWISPS